LIALEIEKIIQQDPGKRGLENWAVQGDLLPAVQSLLEGEHILLATGFHILRAGAIETDGPPGAVILADALVKAGKKVTLLFDKPSEKIMKAALNYAAPSIEYISLIPGTDVLPDGIVRDNTTHFIALERPGKGADGTYRNFSGIDISPYHANLDDLFIHCGKTGITTIGIGDGGNELGMGIVSEAVDRYTGKTLSCRTPAKYCICAGVSNWAGYAAAALLSCMVNENLMADRSVLTGILYAIAEAGAVDGITAEKGMTVDGLDTSWETGILRKLYRFASDAEPGSIAL